MTADEIKETVRHAVREAVAESVPDMVRACLSALGADVENPLEQQKDFAQLREWRASCESIKRMAYGTAVKVFVTALAGAALAYVTNTWHGLFGH